MRVKARDERSTFVECPFFFVFVFVFFSKNLIL